jgi:hypothetical protein
VPGRLNATELRKPLTPVLGVKITIFILRSMLTSSYRVLPRQRLLHGTTNVRYHKPQALAETMMVLRTGLPRNSAFSTAVGVPRRYLRLII